MEKFLKKLFELDNYVDKEEEQKNQIDTFKSSFSECDFFEKKDINKLNFLSIEKDDESALFKFSKSNTIYKYKFFDCCWTEPCVRYTLNVGNNYELNDVNLIENSSNSIEYVLYPFYQDNIIPNKYLMIDDGQFIDETLLKKIFSTDNTDFDLIYNVKWTDKLSLVVTHDDSTYKILSNGEFLSGFVDNPAHFQLGDGSTEVYTYNENNLIIMNIGDVSSIVIVKKTK